MNKKNTKHKKNIECFLAFAAVLIMALAFPFSSMQAQTTGCGCNNQVNVGINDVKGGKTLVTREMVLESASTCSNKYIQLVHNNIVIAGPADSVYVDCALVNQYVRAEILDENGSMLCWGWLFFEDKKAPTTSINDVTISCEDSIDPDAINTDASPTGNGYPTSADNCEVASTKFNDVSVNINDCGVGSFRRVWTVEDASGNSASTSQIITILDTTAPKIEFPKDVELTCDNATSTDPSVTGSPTMSDNCSQLMLRHEDANFSKCAGACEKILRHWEIIDWCNYDARIGSGIYQHTQIIVITDNVEPTITLGEDLSFGMGHTSCDSDFTLPAPASTGDNCDSAPTWSVQLVRSNNTTISGSGANGRVYNNITQGTYTALYTVYDCCGNSSEASIKVSVVDDVPPSALCDNSTNITLTNSTGSSSGDGWAEICKGSVDDGSSDNCGVSSTKIRIQGTTPWSDCVIVTCANVGSVNIELRVVDAAGNQSICWMTAVVEDKNPPVISCPAAITLACDADLEDTTITGLPTASDNCTIRTLDFNDSTSDISNCGIGTIVRTWTALDQSGNSATCLQLITLVDNTPITVSVPDDISVPCTGFENGNPDIDVTGDLAVNTDCEFTSVARLLDIRFVLTGTRNEQIRRSWLVQNLCTSKVDTFTQLITLTNCSAAFTGSFAGNLAFPSDVDVTNINAVISNNAGEGLFEKTISGSTFSFDDVPTNQDLRLNVFGEVANYQHLSTLDILLIRQHLLGYKSLATPYKVLAADINRSGTVSTADIIELRKRILGIHNSPASVPSLLFVNASEIDQEDPLESSTYYGLSEDVNAEAVDFIGIATGDVSGNTFLVDPSSSERSSQSEAILDVNLHVEKLNESQALVQFKLPQGVSLAGFQMALSFDPKIMSFAKIAEKGALTFGTEHLGLDRAEEGLLLISYDQAINSSTEAGIVDFGLIFNTSNISEVKNYISFNDQVLQAELYDETLNTYKLSLHYDDELLESSEKDLLEVYQNRPNPFKTQTIILFALAQSKEVTCSVYDAQGNRQHFLKSFYPKGLNEMVVPASSLGADGVYFYTIATAEQVVTKRMIVVRE